MKVGVINAFYIGEKKVNKKGKETKREIAKVGTVIDIKSKEEIERLVKAECVEVISK